MKARILDILMYLVFLTLIGVCALSLKALAVSRSEAVEYKGAYSYAVGEIEALSRTSHKLKRNPAFECHLKTGATL